MNASTLRSARKMVLAAAVLLSCLALAAKSAHAYTCDFYTDQSTVTYNATTGSLNFSVTGLPETFDVDGVAPPDYWVVASPTDTADYGTFSVSIAVNTSNGTVNSGTLTIDGALADYNTLDAETPATMPGLGTTGTLLQANIVSITPEGAGNLDLTFNDPTGDVVPAYWGPGPWPQSSPLSEAFMQLHNCGSSATDWYATSFSSGEGNAYSDTYASGTPVVPEPGTASLMLACFGAGLAGCAFRRWRKSPISM